LSGMRWWWWWGMREGGSSGQGIREGVGWASAGSWSLGVVMVVGGVVMVVGV
jgi:hypothetical protein